MPIYEYKCSNCDTKLNKLQKISDKPLKTCPECGKETLAKQLSSASFVLKGTGWYATDFKDQKDKKVIDNSSPETKSETKSDTKSETKADTATATAASSESTSKPKPSTSVSPDSSSPSSS